MAAKVKLVWSRPALDDLRTIRDYIRRNSPQAATRLADRIRSEVLHLRDHPRAGRIVPELADRGLREVIVSPFRIVFLIEKKAVVIVRIWHGRRDLASVR